MQENEYPTGDLTEPLADFDLTPGGGWIGTTGGGLQQYLLFNGHSVPSPAVCRSPLVRAMGDDRLVLADAAPHGENKNAWIVTADGQVQANFRVGAFIDDIIVLNRVIAFTYTDHAFGKPERLDGIVFFDDRGQRTHHYSEIDCYCACALDPAHMLTLLHPGFPLVIFDIATYRKTVLTAPEILASANAVTCAGEVVFFHSPYTDQHGIFRWKFGEAEARRVAEYEEEIIRGLSGGRFLAYGSRGYTIVSLADEI